MEVFGGHDLQKINWDASHRPFSRLEKGFVKVLGGSIPLSKWVITPVISGLTLLIPFITGVITHLLRWDEPPSKAPCPFGGYFQMLPFSAYWRPQKRVGDVGGVGSVG